MDFFYKRWLHRKKYQYLNYIEILLVQLYTIYLKETDSHQVVVYTN